MFAQTQIISCNSLLSVHQFARVHRLRACTCHPRILLLLCTPTPGIRVADPLRKQHSLSTAGAQLNQNRQADPLKTQAALQPAGTVRMRRRPGIAGLQRDVQAREQFKSAGEEVRRAALQQMKDQLVIFKSKLEEFAMKHKSDIRRDPVFRAQFHTMCANIGVDPLASNKGMWNELLGFGDFYYELGVQLLEACLASRPINGGMFELGALRAAVERRRGSRSDPVSEDDIIRAIKKLKVLGGGIDVVTIGVRTYIRSVPGEFNMDKNKVMEVAQQQGFISAAELSSRASWTKERCDKVLSEMLREGLAMIDDGAPGGVRLYWFPALSNQQQQQAGS